MTSRKRTRGAPTASPATPDDPLAFLNAEAAPTKPFTDAFRTPWAAEDSFGAPATVDAARRRLYLPFVDTEPARNARRLVLAASQWQPVQDLLAEAPRLGVSYQSLYYAAKIRLVKMLRREGLDMADGVPESPGADALCAEIGARLEQKRPLSAVRALVYGLVDFYGTNAGARLLEAVAETPLAPFLRIVPTVTDILDKDTVVLGRYNTTVQPDLVRDMAECGCASCAAKVEQHKEEIRRLTEQGLAVVKTPDRYLPIPWDKAVEVARFLDTLLAQAAAAMAGDGEGENDSRKEDQGENGGGVPDEDSVRQMIAIAKEPRDNNRPHRWGEMTVVEPPRTVYHPEVRAARRRRATEAGLAPRAVHRLITDGKVFSVRYKQFGGAVLIDASGSMGMTTEDIRTLLRLAPSACVACYSGDGPAGELIVLAKDGRAVHEDDIPYTKGGNVIDYPALQWLAKQGGPRIWVSDGWATGVGDRYTSEGDLQCKMFIRRKSIRRVESTAAAIEFFRQRREAAANR